MEIVAKMFIVMGRRGRGSARKPRGRSWGLAGRRCSLDVNDEMGEVVPGEIRASARFRVTDVDRRSAASSGRLSARAPCSAPCMGGSAARASARPMKTLQEMGGM